MHIQTRAGEVEKRLNGGNSIIAAIIETISDARRIPLYVAEGPAGAMMAKINFMHFICATAIGSRVQRPACFSSMAMPLHRTTAISTAPYFDRG
jgi:hypothetical protein